MPGIEKSQSLHEQIISLLITATKNSSKAPFKLSDNDNTINETAEKIAALCANDSIGLNTTLHTLLHGCFIHVIALHALAKLDPKIAKHPITELLYGDDESTLGAIWIIKENRLTGFTQNLFRLMDDRTIRNEHLELAIDTLASFGTIDCIDSLLRLRGRLRDSACEERLQKHLDAVLPLPYDEMEEGLCSLDSRVRREMAKKLASFGAKAVPFIRNFISTSTSKYKGEAAELSMRMVVDPEAIPYLCECMTETSLCILDPARIALVRFKEQAIPELLNLYESSSQGRLSSLAVFARIDSPSAKLILLSTAEFGEPHEQAEALFVLFNSMHFKDARVAGLAQKAMKNGNPKAKKSAIRILCRKGERLELVVAALFEKCRPGDTERVPFCAADALGSWGHASLAVDSLTDRMRHDPLNRQHYMELISFARRGEENSCRSGKIPGAPCTMGFDSLELKRFPKNPLAVAQPAIPRMKLPKNVIAARP